jgi:hypothetical protein
MYTTVPHYKREPENIHLLISALGINRAKNSENQVFESQVGLNQYFVGLTANSKILRESFL